MKKLILCADNRSISQEGYWKYMIQTTQHYAKLHNIDFHFEQYTSDFERHLSWRRIELFKTFSEKYDEIFWIDSDATIINPQINIFDYIRKTPESPTWRHDESTTPFIYALTDKPFTSFACAGIMMLDCRNKEQIQNVLNSWWDDVPEHKYITEHPWEQSVWNLKWYNDHVKRNWIRVCDIPSFSENQKDQVFIHLIHSRNQNRLYDAIYYSKRAILSNKCNKKIGIVIDKEKDNETSVYLRHLFESQGHNVEFLVNNVPIEKCDFSRDMPYYLYNLTEINLHDYCQIIFTSYLPSKSIVSQIRNVMKAIFFFQNELPANDYIFDEVWYNDFSQNIGLLESYKMFNSSTFIKKITNYWDSCFHKNNSSSIVSSELQHIVINEESDLDTYNSFQKAIKLPFEKIYIFNCPDNSLLKNHPLVLSKKVSIFAKIPKMEIIEHFLTKNTLFILSSSQLSYFHLDLIYHNFKLIHMIPSLKYGSLATNDTMILDKKILQDFTPSYFHCCNSIYNLNEPLLVSYDNLPNENTYALRDTLDKNKWNYIFIGMGEVWKGYTNKMQGYLQYLKKLHPNKIVILSDARDVLCLRSPEYFLEGYLSYKKEMVVSMETICNGIFDRETLSGNCLPITPYWKYHNIVEKPIRKFVNSGLIAGTSKVLIEYLQFSFENGHKDDQIALSSFVNAYPEKVGVDTSADLLHTTNAGIHRGIQDLEIQTFDSPNLFELLGRNAFFLHIPGQNFYEGQKELFEIAKNIITDTTIEYGHPLKKTFKWKEKNLVTFHEVKLRV